MPIADNETQKYYDERMWLDRRRRLADARSQVARLEYELCKAQWDVYWCEREWPELL